MKKYIIISFVAILILISLWHYFKINKSTDDNAKKEEMPAFSVVKGNVRSSVASTGRIVSNLDVEIKCKASGEIITLPYEVSNQVKQGALLVELDPVDEMRLVKQSEISLASSKASLTQAEKELSLAEKNLIVEKKLAESAFASATAKTADLKSKMERLKGLFENKIVSPEEYDTAKTSHIQAESALEDTKTRIGEISIKEDAIELKRQDVKLSEGKVAADTIQLENARQRLKDTKVTAPINGVVSMSNVQKGQIISSGISNVGGGTTILTLSDVSRIFVLASVDESDIGKIAIGQPVNITVDAYQGKIFNGKVTRVATKGVNLSNVVTFEVKIEVTSENKNMLRLEMTASVEIVAEDKDNVVIIPAEAFYRKEKESFVQRLAADGKKTETKVLTGITDGINVEILSGISEGDTIIIDSSKADNPWRKNAQNGKQGKPDRTMMMLGGGRYR